MIAKIVGFCFFLAILQTWVYNETYRTWSEVSRHKIQNQKNGYVLIAARLLPQHKILHTPYKSHTCIKRVQSSLSVSGKDSYPNQQGPSLEYHNLIVFRAERRLAVVLNYVLYSLMEDVDDNDGRSKLSRQHVVMST